MISLRECQQAAREMKQQLNILFGMSGSYKTTSSWSDKKYVELVYSLVRGYDEQGNVGLFTIDYDDAKVEQIFKTVCDKYHIDTYNSGLTMSDTRVEIRLYSDESAK